MNDLYTFGVRILAPCDGEVIATKDGSRTACPWTRIPRIRTAIT
jgi:hypothetical protein